MTATKTADKVANETFTAHLVRTRACATAVVPDCVVEAAEKAFADAGGEGEIVVAGNCNAARHVCSVTVRRVKARR